METNSCIYLEKIVFWGIKKLTLKGKVKYEFH